MIKISPCISCGTRDKGYKTKRCQSCFASYYGSEEWAKSEEEIERRKKISINNGKSNLGGRIMTPEVRRKIGLVHIGNKYNLGKRNALGYKHTEESLLKMREDKNPHWKGDRVGYVGLHMWVYKKLGKPDTCEFCEKTGLSGKQINWANRSGDYKRDLTDWLRLCASCHAKYDGNRGRKPINQLELV